MKKERNRRTLKKRIRKVISLSTFITVLFLSGAIISLILVASRHFAKIESKIACDSIQQELISGAGLKPLGVKSIEEIGKDNLNINIWFKTIKNQKKVQERVGDPLLKGELRN